MSLQGVKEPRWRILLAQPFYFVGTAFIIVADWLDPRPKGPNG